MNDTLIQKIQSGQRCIERARDIYQKNRLTFLWNYDAQDAAVLNLVRACELSIDIANYVIKRDKLGIPASSAESFELLARREKISHHLAAKLKLMVGFRNVAVHEYRRIDYAIVIEIIEDGLNDIIGFMERIMELSL